MKIKTIKTGDFIYNPWLKTIGEITGFSHDKLGQKAILFKTKRKHYYATAWVVFKYMVILK